MFKAILNEEGKKVWGKIFPDGLVPVNTPYPVKTQLGDEGEQLVYLVAWAALTATQKDLILSQLQKTFQAKYARAVFKPEIESQIQEKGMPLRASLVSTVSMPMRYFS